MKHLMARMDVGIRRYMSRFTAVKLLLTLVLVSMPNILFGTPKHALIAMGEIVVAYFIYIFMGRRLWILGYLISSLATFLVITQEWVRYFSGSYTTKIMLDNLANIKALGPALPRYILIVALVVIISFFPAKFNQYPKIPWRFVFLGLGTVFMWGLFYTGRRTAVTDSVSLVREYQEAAKTTRRLEAAQANRAKIIRSFEKTSVPGGISLGKEKYNVIVVFAEGTSRRTIEETGAKYPGLMPNLQRFSQETINFTNYFNHTAPTYKGLRGQLNSAFQYYEGYEDAKNAAQIKARTKTPLIGLPQILRNHSYTAKFINPEPKHEQFTPYLQSLGFNSVISDSPKVWSRSGNTTYLSDKNNFRLLMNQAEKLNSQNKKFFLGTYTLETHNGWNVTDNKYRKGDNAVLNKFHNLDTVFGEFLNRFMASPLKDNTILVFTTDHASYASPDYASVMDDHRSTFVSTIPLMIYYPGVKGETIDAKGRNSLGLAPTILDLLDIGRVKNYFLGTSLFTTKPTGYEYTTEIGENFYSTKTQQVAPLSPTEEKLKNKILQFDSFSLKMK